MRRSHLVIHQTLSFLEQNSGCYTDALSSEFDDLGLKYHAFLLMDIDYVNEARGQFRLTWNGHDALAFYNSAKAWLKPFEPNQTPEAIEAYFEQAFAGIHNNPMWGRGAAQLLDCVIPSLVALENIGIRLNDVDLLEDELSIDRISLLSTDPDVPARQRRLIRAYINELQLMNQDNPDAHAIFVLTALRPFKHLV